MRYKEVQKREALKARYNKVITRQFDDKLTRHDSIECMQCKNYTYLSYATCIVCSRKACIHHSSVCACVGSTIILQVRFTEEVNNFFRTFILIFLLGIERVLKEFEKIILQ